MGLFKRNDPQEPHWTDEVEDFSNFAVGLKIATDNIIEAAVRDDEELCEQLWTQMTTEQRQYGFWFLLGMVASVIQEQQKYE
jgi:hypothetical protein